MVEYRDISHHEHPLAVSALQFPHRAWSAQGEATEGSAQAFILPPRAMQVALLYELLALWKHPFMAGASHHPHLELAEHEPQSEYFPQYSAG